MEEEERVTERNPANISTQSHERGYVNYTVVLRKNGVRAFERCQISSDKTRILRKTSTYFSLKFSDTLDFIAVKFPENFKDIYSEVFRKIRILSEEIWQRLNAHTAFFLSTAVLARPKLNLKFNFYPLCESLERRSR